MGFYTKGCQRTFVSITSNGRSKPIVNFGAANANKESLATNAA